jgi:RNA 2',3'-cyclic 3'-phosphodiesterase
MPRLFVAIDVPDTFAPELMRLQDDSLPARWTRPDQFHLTLKFIGHVAEEQAVEIQLRLSTVQAKAFSMHIAGLGAFPNPRRARVLVASVKADNALIDLSDAVETTLEAVGIEREKRPLRPHITIARLKEPDPDLVRAYLHRHDGFRLGPFSASSFHLYESRLHPSGAAYTRLHTYELQM